MSTFDNLTKKEQAAIVQASKLGKEWEKAAKKSEKVGKGAGGAFDKLTKRVMVNIDAVQLLSKAWQAARMEYERYERRQGKAAADQVTFVDAIQNFKQNNQEAVLNNKNLVDQVTKFAMREGALIGPTGPTELIRGLTQARSDVGDAFTLEQQFTALKEGALARRLGGAEVDVGEITAANLRTQQVLQVNAQQAQNILTQFGSIARGDVNKFVGEFGKLSGIASALDITETKKFGERKTDFADVLGLAGFLSQQSGLSPEEATTVTRSVLQNLTRASIGKRKIDFKADNAVERLIEISQRILAGEFGEGRERSQLLASLGLRGANALSTVALVGGKEEVLKGGISRVRRGTDFAGSMQERVVAEQTTLERGVQRERAMGGAATVARIADPDAERDRVIKASKDAFEAVGVNMADVFGAKIENIFIRLGLADPEVFAKKRLGIVQRAARGQDLGAGEQIVIDLLQQIADNGAPSDKTKDTGGQKE
jgi:hypothetical protein